MTLAMLGLLLLSACAQFERVTGVEVVLPDQRDRATVCRMYAPNSIIQSAGDRTRIYQKCMTVGASDSPSRSHAAAAAPGITLPPPKRRPLGLEVLPVTADPAAATKQSEGEGLYVLRVLPNGVGAAALILPDDVIMSFDGARMRSVEDLQTALASVGRGASVQIGLSREGRSRIVKALF